MRQIVPKLADVQMNVIGNESEGCDAWQAGERFDPAADFAPAGTIHSICSRRGAKSEPVRELNESLESLVIQERRPESLVEVADVEQRKPRSL